MKKAKQFYDDFISKHDHIVGGSVAIKKQIPAFREPSDLDVMLKNEFLTPYLLKSPEIECTKSEYGNGIFSLVFEDNSKIDLIRFDREDGEITVKIGNIKYLCLDEIIKYKMLLIENSISEKKFNEYNKHLRDVLFIFKNK